MPSPLHAAYIVPDPPVPTSGETPPGSGASSGRFGSYGGGAEPAFVTLSRARNASSSGAIQRASTSALSSSPSSVPRRPSLQGGSPASSSPIFGQGSFSSAPGMPMAPPASSGPTSNLHRMSASPSGLGFVAASRVAGASSFGSRSPLAGDVGPRPILGHSPASSTGATAGPGLGRHVSGGSYSRSFGRASSSLGTGGGNWGGRELPDPKRFLSETSEAEAAEIAAFLGDIDARPGLSTSGLATSRISRQQASETMNALRGSVYGSAGEPGSGGGSRASPSPPAYLGNSPRLSSLRHQGSQLSIREEPETAQPEEGSSSRPASGFGFAPYQPARARTPLTGSASGTAVGSPLPVGIGHANARARGFDPSVDATDSPDPRSLAASVTPSSLAHSAVDVDPAQEVDEAVGRLELGDSVDPTQVPLPEDDRGRGHFPSRPGSRERTPGQLGQGEFPFALGARAGSWGMEFDG